MRRLTILGLTLCAALILCGSALAAGPAGIRVLTRDLSSSVTIACQTADGTAVSRSTETTDTEDYPGAEKIQITFTGAESGAQYLVTVQDATGTPTESNLVYIDQKAAEGSSVTFTLFPSAADPSKTYYVYLSSNASAGDVRSQTLAATFTYYQAASSDVLLGDVTQDGNIRVDDALAVLQSVVGKITLEGDQITAADVTRDGNVRVDDALGILQFVVGKITSFD